MPSKIVVAVLVILSGSAPAWAETLEERVDRLEQELRAVKSELAVKQKVGALPPETARAAEAPVVTASAKDGFAIQSADKAHQLKIRGHIQADGRFFTDDEPGASTFTMRRVRPIFEGKVADHYDFRLMPDFGSGTATLADAYIDVNYWKSAKLRAGKFKAPLSLERLQSDADSAFIEIGMPASSLLPNRDTGVQLFGDLWDSRLGYAVSLANGASGGSSLDNDTEDDKELAARVFAHPFKGAAETALDGLGLGIAAGVGHQEGALPVYRTSGQQTFFSYRADTVADGQRLRLVPQAYLYWGPFGLLAEAAVTQEEYRRAGAVSDIENYGWSVGGSYFLTGEENTYKTVTVLRPFDLKSGGPGAWELTGRYTGLRVDDDAFASVANPAVSARRADALTAGLNWRLNRHVKWMLDYEHTMFDGGAAAGDREDEQAVLTRLQLVY